MSPIFYVHRKKNDVLQFNHLQQEQPFSHEFLDRNLRKFGKIESIEILPTGKCEAYVTFENDRNAYLAVAHNELERKSSSHIINIQPADTWVQPQSICADEIPTTNQMDIENMSDFFRLNEDCILELTKYLDLESLVNLSNVCKLLHRLLHQYCFPRYRVYSIRNGSSVPIPLAKVRRTLMCIGPYITELNFRWHDLDFNNRLQRFLDKMGQYVGQNIRVVRFHCLLIDDQCILAIKNILQRLDTLELLVNNQGFELDLDFIEVCPNLRKLKLLENNRLVRCCKPWPQLKHLSMIGNGRFILPKFRLLLEHNPQLTCLKFTARHADDRLQAITQHLPNLQKLTILSSNPDISATNIVSLSSLQHLTTLNLMYLDEDELDGILECLTHFTGLRVLKLHLSFNGKDKDGHFEPNQAAMISLAQDLPHLEKFCTRYIKWEESTLINFIRFASQLQAMHIHWCDLPITNLRLVKIVKVLRRNRPQPQSKPLQLFVNPTVNRRAITGFDVINDQNYTQYLNVRTKCRHLQKGLF